MMQSSEYRVKDYYAWLARTSDFRRIMYRGGLVKTAKVRLLLISSLFLLVAGYGLGFWTILTAENWLTMLLGMVTILITPYVVALVMPIPLHIGEILIQRPRERKLVRRTKQILSEHPGVKIAVAGSYGKTSCKEIIATVLGESLHVAASPGNMNTPIGISRFASKLDGSEDVLIFELGEEKTGDIAQLSEITQPDIGVITGVAAAHLSSFGSLKAAGDTIFELEAYLGDNKPLYKNGDSDEIARRTKQSDPYVYTGQGVGDWKVSDAKSSLAGIEFTVKKGRKIIHARSPLLGLHHVGPLVAAIDIADSLGIEPTAIEAGISYTKPFEHRMELKTISGATVIDDTYNGNILGIRAGLAFLKSLPARRKIYITPGLVEQGPETEKNHRLIGELAAEVADVVILMQNSVTKHMVHGLEESKFSGKLVIVDEPLEFYTNLEFFVAGGDVVLMQNDWTDNYS